MSYKLHRSINIRLLHCLEQSNNKMTSGLNENTLANIFLGHGPIDQVTHCDYKWHCIDHLQYEGYLEDLLPNVPLEKILTGINSMNQ